MSCVSRSTLVSKQIYIYPKTTTHICFSVHSSTSVTFIHYRRSIPESTQRRFDVDTTISRSPVTFSSNTRERVAPDRGRWKRSTEMVKQGSSEDYAATSTLFGRQQRQDERQNERPVLTWIALILS